MKIYKTPGEAVRKKCLECVGGPGEVRKCCGDKLQDGTACPLFPFRLGKGRPSVKTIRRECLKCMHGNRKLICQCASKSCHLHPFRMGRNPNRQQNIPELATGAPVLASETA